ncbi:hypothetical protein SAMN05421688_1512 [Poseidonocella pacifica]|uniref:Uncharacterized protein n=1 Tax=Poseidonocella pacifica TaxID=871651 RepID=A0A1I0WJT3_9RHOB|nr:hypothetical protein SAMN05421688_1512 [Poseidonocella pacifica]
MVRRSLAEASGHLKRHFPKIRTTWGGHAIGARRQSCHSDIWKVGRPTLASTGCGIVPPPPSWTAAAWMRLTRSG